MATKQQIKEYLPDVNKNYIWGAVVVIGAILGIYFYGKTNGSYTPYILPNETLPDGTTSTNDPNKITQTEQSDITSISNALKVIIEGYFNIDYSAYKRMLTCSDRVFVGVYNFYNANFSSVPDTLRSKIEGQRSWYLPFTQSDNDTLAILARMDRLNLK